MGNVICHCPSEGHSIGKRKLCSMSLEDVINVARQDRIL